MKADDSVRYPDLARALGIDLRKAENWQTRQRLPITLLPPLAKGFAGRVHINDIERAATWMVAAAIVGPKRADEYFELNGDDKYPNALRLTVGCVSFAVDLQPMRVAISPFFKLRATLVA